MRIHRAHDGRTIDVQQPLSNFGSVDELLDSLSLATAIPADGIICMSADGVQLSDDLLATLSAQATDSSSSHLVDFFVFSRDFLYADVDSIAQELAESPNLARPVEAIDIVRPPTPRSLEALVAWTHQVLEAIHSHASTSRSHHEALCTIQRSTSVALLNLISHSGTVQTNGLSMKERNNAELSRMARLLEGYQRDFEILGLVQVHPRLATSGNSGGSSNSGSRDSSTPNPASTNGSMPSSSKRTLADYVSRVKMGAVADACFKVHSELRARLDELQGNADQLDADTLDVRHDIEGFSIAPSTETSDEAIHTQERAEDLAAFLVDTCAPDDNGWPVADKLQGDALGQVESAVEQLKALDQASREQVRRLTADKNDVIARSLAHLGDISSLQSDYADLAASMAAFQGELTSNRVDGFRHLQRLSNMLWAYGATVVETVRRREFSRHFLTKSQALAELMAKVSARERKRRGKYRTDVAGQLPWEVKGMDEAPPSLEISTTKSTGLTPELERADIDSLVQLIEEIETTLAKADQISGTSSEAAHLTQVKEALRQLVRRLDMMDEEFAVLVEDDLLGERVEDDDEDAGSGHSDTSLAMTKRRARERTGTLEYERKEKERLQREVQELIHQMNQREKADLDRHQVELSTLRTESCSARNESRRLREQLDKERHEAATARAELEALRSDIETERERRINMSDELINLRKEAQAARKDSEQLRREALEESERAADLETQLHDAQAELEEARSARQDASHRIENLLSEGSNVERELSAATERIEDLQQQLEVARHEVREAREAHAEAETARERAVRSYRAEADSDRAILEESLREREAEVATARYELERVKESTRVEMEAAQTLRSQLRGADEAHEELVKTMEAAKDGCAEAEFGKRHAEREREQLHELVKPLLQAFIELEEHVQGLPALSSSRTPSTSAADRNGDATNEAAPSSAIKEETNALRRTALVSFASSATSSKPVDPEVTLSALRLLSPHSTSDTVKQKLTLLVTLVRKWQKTFKRHSQEASTRLSLATRERIAFRNFAVGDLALFLPSRNNVLDPKPWAAFNVACPHFFLNAPQGSVLAEQLRQKEWIVARIVGMVERTTSGQQGGEGNPFQLPEGTKYCLLDVDGWNPNSGIAATRPSKSRQVSTRSAKGAAGALADVPEQDSGAGRRESSSGDASLPDTPAAEKPADLAPLTSMVDAPAIEAPLETPSLTSPEAVLAATVPTSTNSEAPAVRGRQEITARPLDTSASSSPSALTRAILASRSNSLSRPGSVIVHPAPTDENNLTSSTSTAPATSTGAPRETSKGAISRSATEASNLGHRGEGSMTSSGGGSVTASRNIPNPAFGVRSSRRRGLLRTPSGQIASAATSPGGTVGVSSLGGAARALSASAGGRVADLAFESMGNPFSQSPGAAQLGSSMPKGMAAAQGAAAASSPPDGKPANGNDAAPSSPSATAVGKRRAPSSGTSTSPAGSSGFAFTRPSGSGTGRPASSFSPSNASGSVISLAATPMPSLAAADLTSALGETSKHSRASSSGMGQAAASSSSFSAGSGERAGGSGFSTSTMAGGAEQSTSPNKSSTMPRSPSFLSRTFGRKMSSGAAGTSSLASRRTPVQSIFPGTSQQQGQIGGSGGEGTSPASASQLLRRLSERQGGSPP
ncbi:hypothetical protein BDZ90DRAFT_229208 [Jaminaea rosea]|uniref:Autophagy-related protein 11 n=1 Tax=Jaminaea rosea TaxID=1569628 RepID=A0A316UXZ4_9BASI|nr:hypothetical protein BDZ90DRAFT_229208 [Jaminaea rosea]PWN30187.1 hypothetical protein BDZ90DRAFT_229208 [Jaminaea rosea]